MWKLFTEAERQLVATVARGDSTTPAQTPAVDSLTQRGYLLQQSERLMVFSECFRAFALEQNPSVTPAPLQQPTAIPACVLAQARVFLSYASEDREAVRDLYKRLKSSGLDPWMDAENLIVGDAWARSVDEAIQSADFFIICLSTHSVEKSGTHAGDVPRNRSMVSTLGPG